MQSNHSADAFEQRASLAPPTERAQGTKKPSLWLRGLGLLLLVCALIAVWQFTDIRELDSAQRVASAIKALRASPLAALFVFGAFVVGTVLCMPITLLIAGTVLALGPSQGLPCALVGSLCGAALAYVIGKLLGHAPLAALESPRFRKLYAGLNKSGFRTTLLARLLPVGNFTLLNLLLGSLGVPFRGFILGNVVGLAPWLAFVGVFYKSLSSILE
jgi:phospholipase D1/2